MCTNPRKIIVNGEEVTIKCGKCLTCRMERRADWTIKLINEARYHKYCCFITLTFSNQILLDKNSKAYKYGANPNFVFHIQNSKNYFTKFIKRLRKKFKDRRITYYHIGEYGEKGKRPHHHVLLFGVNFIEDRKEAEISKSGFPQYYSQTLEDLWACGRTRIQEVNSNNIAYISGYCLKKYKKKEIQERYKPIQSFSNRSKMNVRFIRKHPELIRLGYLEDIDGKKYRVPKSYKETLKNDENEYYNRWYQQYEEKIMSHIEKIGEKELIKRQKAKEKIYEKRNDTKYREF